MPRYPPRGRVPVRMAAATAVRVGNWKHVVRASRARRAFNRRMGLSQNVRSLNRQVSHLNKMIETKEYTWKTSANVAMPHNNITIVQQQSGGDLNVFRSSNSTDDPMGVGGSRIGDSIKLKGVAIVGFFENSLSRPKVFYRVMMIRCAKGDTISRATLFRGCADNKMIDQINTERFSIIKQKVFTIAASGAQPAQAVNASGEPDPNATRGGIATRRFKMWIPGYKFRRGGIIQYENNSQTQVKFFDYRLVILVYDWYGTPQDVNNVGRINELYSKVYLQDA